jgi:hypothetical protein
MRCNEMRKSGLCLVGLFFTLQTAPFAQQLEKPSPTFALSIEVDQDAVRMNPTLHRVLVKFTRTAIGDEVEQFHEEAKGMYEMIVLRDGIPAKETDALRELRLYRKRDGSPTIRNPRLLKMGESWITPLDVSDYYDMSEPGIYQITVTRGTNPGFPPPYSVLVSSNTLTIVVPRTAVGSPRTSADKSRPRFDLTISPEDPDDIPPDWVLVSITNTSKSAIRERKCWPFYGMYNFVVLRNGDPLRESEDMEKLQRIRADVRCPGNESLLEIEPGNVYADRVALGNYFDIHEPGSYVVYATRETYPYNPAKSVLVESSPMSFVVPEPPPVTDTPPDSH